MTFYLNWLLTLKLIFILVVFPLFLCICLCLLFVACMLLTWRLPGTWLTKLSRTQRSFGTFIAVKLNPIDSLQPLEETYLLLILYSILLTKPNHLTNIFTQFLCSHVDNEPPPPGCHTKVSVRECLSHITLPVCDVLTTLLHLTVLCKSNANEFRRNSWLFEEILLATIFRRNFAAFS